MKEAAGSLPSDIKIVFLSHLDQNLYRFRLPIMLELVHMGFSVFALTPKGDFSRKFQDLGIVHVPYSVTRKSLNIFRELKTVFELIQILRNLKPTLLHTFVAKPNIYGTIAGKLAGVPVIINNVTGLGSYYIENDFKTRIVRSFINGLYRIVFHLSDHVIFQNSDDWMEFKDKRICRKNNSSVIRGSGIDTGTFRPGSICRERLTELRSELGLKEKSIVMTAGRLLKHKGITEYCLSAHEILKEKRLRDSVAFILVGRYDDGNPFSVDRKLVDQHVQQGDILYLGWRADIKELIALCDIFVLASYREGIPRTLIEASAMSKPIVTTDTVGCREVVKNRHNGILVPPMDSGSLAAAIKILVDHKKLRESYGVKGRKKAIEEFDVKIVIERLLELYQSLIRKKTKRRSGEA